MRLHPQDRVDEFTEAGWWGQESWSALLERNIAERGESLAVADPSNRASLTDGEPRELTWAQLGELTDRLAKVLLAHEVGRDDVVGVQLINSVELAAMYLATASIGAIISPLPVQYREYELGQLAKLAQFKVFVTATRIADHQPAAAAVSLRGQLPELRYVLAFGADVPEGAVAIDQLLVDDSTTSDDELAQARAFEFDPNDCLTICWTSGTESTPKGVPRCANDWYPMALASVDAAELTKDDVLLNPFPMVNMAGIGGILVPWLLTGATLIQHQPFDPQVFFGQIAARGVTYTVAPPALLTMVLAREDIPAALFTSVRVVGSGSAPLSEHMISGWKSKFDIEVINCFGSNEGASLAGDPVTIPDAARRAAFFPRFGSPDHEWPNGASKGMRSRIVDLATGADIEHAGQPGELRIAGPGVFAGYLAGTGGEDAFDEQGFFRTGDVFQYAADDTGDLRYLQYVDRAKDIIVRGGMNISPAEVEALITSLSSVAEVAIIGVPDPILGERACAVVVPAGDAQPTLDDLVTHLRTAQIASYKIPESIRIVGALPRNPVGKILKRQLRDSSEVATA